MVAAAIRVAAAAEGAKLGCARAVAAVSLVARALDASLRVVGRERGPVRAVDKVLVEPVRPGTVGPVWPWAVRR